jgi:hypothetical protein
VLFLSRLALPGEVLHHFKCCMEAEGAHKVRVDDLFKEDRHPRLLQIAVLCGVVYEL